MQMNSKAMQDENKHARASATSQYVIKHQSHVNDMANIMMWCKLLTEYSVNNICEYSLNAIIKKHIVVTNSETWQ